MSHGDRAPDAAFQNDQGQAIALHRLRGRPLLLNFWQSWSAPCLTELRRLQTLNDAAPTKGPFIIAFHGGKSASTLAEIRRQLGLTFVLVHDAEQRVASQYGVRCWPTTILVRADGRVEHIQFGIMSAHEHSPVPDAPVA